MSPHLRHSAKFAFLLLLAKMRIYAESDLVLLAISNDSMLFEPDNIFVYPSLHKLLAAFTH